MTQLVLELQAEIDKYATALLAGNGVGIMKERSRTLRRKLLDEAELLDELDDEERERYRTATRLASRYAASLEERFVGKGDLKGLARELRRFYRMSFVGKVEAADER